MNGGALAFPEPYAYPTAPHERRHGPTGYSSYDSYRPWLEDDFAFRCVYCLKRMVWAPTDIWAIDHVISKYQAPHLECTYDNLVLACQCCNRQKSSHNLADPCLVAYGSLLRLEKDGKLIALNPKGKRILDTIRLNHPKYIQERLKTLRYLELARYHDPKEFERLMGVPENLTDLSKLVPPGGNLRPEGILESYFAKKFEKP